LNTKEYISSGIIESYILGLASPEEAGILECVMKNNAEVKAAFEEAQKTLEDLATAQAAPPADLKSKIWNKIQQEQTAEEEKPVFSADIPAAKPQEEIRIQGNNNWKVYTVAASVLLLVSVGGNIFWMNSQKETKAAIAKMETEKMLRILQCRE
jgi:anti-sigma-K factor RskA